MFVLYDLWSTDVKKKEDCVNVMFKSARFYSHVIATFWQITGINPLFKWIQDKQVHQIERDFYFQFLKANV